MVDGLIYASSMVMPDSVRIRHACRDACLVRGVGDYSPGNSSRGMAVRSQASHGAGPDGPRAGTCAAGVNRRRARIGQPIQRDSSRHRGADDREPVDEL
jgi:hypothetical protein